MAERQRCARVGLIADTHGLVRPEALDSLRGVDRILHAGDVGAPEVLDALAAVAPVTAVRGNVDHGAWARALPLTAELRICGVWFLVLHVLDDLNLDPRAAGFDVVVSGHSHVPRVDRRNDVLYVNPGSAGPRRFRLPASVAVAEIEARRARVDLVRLG